MGSAEICTQCGWAFDAEALAFNACKKCRSAILITSVAFLEKFERPAIQKYVVRYSEVLKKDPDDRDALISLGVCYLKLELFDLAERFLDRLLSSHPDDASGYYYKAICRFRGRRPRTSSLNLVREAERLLETAMALEPVNGRYDLLLAAVRHDYYAFNGLRIPEPAPLELMNGVRGKHVDRLEVTQGLGLLKVTESPVTGAI